MTATRVSECAGDPKRDIRDLAQKMSANDPKRTSRRNLIGARFDGAIDYFVIMRLADGGASPGAAGEMTNVSQAFQPSGLFCAANSP
jgi:hypothetical protein